MKLSQTVFAIATLLGAVATAQAATVTFSNIKGTWFDAIPGATITGDATANPVARWGVDTGSGRSGYDFVAAGGSPFVNVPPSPSGQFKLGDFTHVNQPILAPSITGIKLQVTADVDVDGTGVGNKQFVFQFLHDETPNGATPCAYGGANNQGVNINGCADRVTTNFLDASDSFMIGSDQYTINIVGFQLAAGGTPVTEFLTIESLNNTAGLFAEVLVDTRSIPEPGMLALVGVGLLGAAAARRRKA